jgi:hypothetical protein
MTVQSQINLDTTPFILKSRDSITEGNATILQDAGRVAALAPYTLMAQISASKKWVPFTDETAVDGSGIPSGIFLSSDIQGEIPAADLVAGDVVDVPILKFGADIDEAKLVIENTKTLDTVLAAATVNNQTVREALLKIDIVPTNTIPTSNPQT